MTREQYYGRDKTGSYKASYWCYIGIALLILIAAIL